MKKIITILALLCALLPARAQYESFFGQESWEYATAYYPVMGTSDHNPEQLGCLTNTYSFTHTDTVTIAGHKYYNSSFTGLYYNPVKLREDTINGRLYALIDGSEHLICDMSIVLGDTFKLPVPRLNQYVDTMRMKVDSVTFVNSKKIIHLSAISEDDKYWWYSFYSLNGAYNISMRFMEGIGPMCGIYPGGGEALLCLTKDDSLYYMTHPDLGCWQTAVHVPDFPEDYMIIYPNPSNQQIILSFSTEEEVQGNVFIRDILGRVCFQAIATKTEERLNIGNLSPGVYMLTFIDQNNRKITKKVVKQ